MVMPVPGYTPDNSQFPEEERAEAYRIESMQQMHRQTRALESIRTFVAVWFWLSIIGVVIFVAISIAAAQRGY